MNWFIIKYNKDGGTGGQMKKVFIFIITIYSLTLILADEYEGELFSIFCRTPSISNEAAGKSYQAVPDGIMSSYINPAMILNMPNISFVYSNLDKPTHDYSINSFIGGGLRISKYAFTLSNYSSDDLFYHYFNFDGIYYNYRDKESSTKLCMSYSFDKDFSIGFSFSYMAELLSRELLDLYLEYIGEYEPSEFFSTDVGIYKKFRIVNTGKLMNNISLSLAILNDITYKIAGTEPYTTVLPKILNAGISNEMIIVSHDNMLKNFMFRINFGATIYLNATDMNHYGIGSEFQFFKLFTIRLGYYGMDYSKDSTDPIFGNFTYGLGFDFDFKELFNTIPLSIKFNIARVPTFSGMIVELPMEMATGISIELGYLFNIVEN